MVRVKAAGGKMQAEPAFDLQGNEWNSEVHTPIIYKDHFFAVGKKRRGFVHLYELRRQTGLG